LPPPLRKEDFFTGRCVAQVGAKIIDLDQENEHFFASTDAKKTPLFSA
jgi:hypothetical protein